MVLQDYVKQCKKCDEHDNVIYIYIYIYIYIFICVCVCTTIIQV
jgi:hypothetical protein